jgi:hypothetical protein
MSGNGGLRLWMVTADRIRRRGRRGRTRWRVGEPHLGQPGDRQTATSGWVPAAEHACPAVSDTVPMLNDMRGSR